MARQNPTRSGSGCSRSSRWCSWRRWSPARHLLKGARIDLTENRLYTLSAGTRALLSRIEEPISLTLFFSERAARDFPACAATPSVSANCSRR
jgi:hypothetical protein